MERRVFEGNVAQVAIGVAEWLGTDPQFILDSYQEGEFERPRYFERLGQKHATLRITG